MNEFSEVNYLLSCGSEGLNSGHQKTADTLLLIHLGDSGFVSD